MRRDELRGIPRALYSATNRARSVLEVFPPIGAGAAAAGIGIGCGFGWPLRAAYGPPRAFCGPGIGVAVVGAGYGQGFFGRRFGNDTRSSEAIRNLKAIEKRIEQSTTNVVRLIRRKVDKLISRIAVPLGRIEREILTWRCPRPASR